MAKDSQCATTCSVVPDTVSFAFPSTHIKMLHFVQILPALVSFAYVNDKDLLYGSLHDLLVYIHNLQAQHHLFHILYNNRVTN